CARMRFDNDWIFEAQRPTPVDGNTAVILGESWLKRHFEVRGDRSQHFGRFVSHNSSNSYRKNDVWPYETREIEDGTEYYYPVSSRVPGEIPVATVRRDSSVYDEYNDGRGS